MTGAVYYLNCVLIIIIFWSGSRSGRKRASFVGGSGADLEKHPAMWTRKRVKIVERVMKDVLGTIPKYSNKGFFILMRNG